MHRFSEQEGIAHFINSLLNKTEITQVKTDIHSGKCKLLYVAPESLNKDENVKFLCGCKISFVAINKAHCISEWVHDFRPEYRRLCLIIEQIADCPIMALTATAMPKVQQDIQKNLGMLDAKLLKALFNRANLFYEIRAKKNVGKQIIQYIKANMGKSGIIYCLSRRKTKENAELLQVNGIKALPYHGGMESSHRSRVQDAFLMQDTNVICAIIAFGMGINKPDVIFQIHHNIPKSLESYYQETGCAVHNGGKGVCIAFYSPKDIEKCEKFLQGKPVAEEEIGMLLIQEVVAYAKMAMSRRKYLLHYFGEEWDDVNGKGAGMDNNSRNPKKLYDGTKHVQTILNCIDEFNKLHKAGFICKVIAGVKTSEVTMYKGHLSKYFGDGSEQDEKFWNAEVRQMYLHRLLTKEIETYGTLKITNVGRAFMKNPTTFKIVKEEEIGEVDDDELIIPKHGGGAVDEVLFGLLKELRAKMGYNSTTRP